jgi:alkyl hydroperoxide reductase subunit AhpC
LDTEIYPILVDRLENAQQMEHKYAKDKFPIYYDSNNAIAKQLNQEIRLLKLGRMPGMLLVDKQGVVRYAYYSDNMHDIPAVTDTVEMAKLVQDGSSTE